MKKNYKQLTSEQRYAIFLGLENELSQSEIARSIGVSASTVSRELKRNRNKRGGYSWRLAQEMADERKERLPGNRSTPGWVKRKVIKLLTENHWSPRQISGWLWKHEKIAISHETIYRWIREDKKAGGNLYTYCRHRMKHRKRPVGTATNIPNRTSIRERPKEADGSRFGDFEMDTIVGKGQKEAMLTITEKLKVKVYFTDSYSAWQKGAIENANKLIRQFIPKGTSFKDYSDEQVKQIQYKLNNRPREKLNFSTPKVEFYKQFL
ncbi:MAG: IS30 family transposase [Fermentimonas sp.]